MERGIYWWKRSKYEVCICVKLKKKALERLFCSDSQFRERKDEVFADVEISKGRFEDDDSVIVENENMRKGRFNNDSEAVKKLTNENVFKGRFEYDFLMNSCSMKKDPCTHIFEDDGPAVVKNEADLRNKDLCKRRLEDCSALWMSHDKKYHPSKGIFEKDNAAAAKNGLSKGIFEDDSVVVALLKSCAKRKDLSKGSLIHADIVKQGLLTRNLFVGNTLVDMYAKCGALVKARQVFDELLLRDVVSWTILISGYTRHGQSEAALDCFEQMQSEGISPNAVTYACILKSCASLGAAEKGKEIHAEIIREGFLGKHSVLGNALVDMYVKCGALTKAKEVFDELVDPDLLSWTSLISGYAQHGLGEEALNCFDRMQHEGFTPDAVTFSCVLKACSSIGAISKGEEIHDEILRKGLLRNNSVLGNALVDMYAKCGALAKAQKAFDELSIHDIVSWTALIAGYAQHGHGQEALYYFGQMQREGLSPNAITFACILKACGNIGATEKGKDIHAEIVREGLLTHNSVLGTALVDMYAKCGELAKALQVFDELPFRNVASFNALIAGYCQHEHDKEALECFVRIQREGLFPDRVTFASTLKACGSVGATNKGKQIHVDIIREGLLGDDIVLGNALVDMYAKCGAIGKARHVLDELNFQDAVSWNALMTGYCQHESGYEALTCFHQMQQQGLFPDAVTFSSILKACGTVGATRKGKEIHTRISKEWLPAENNLLGNALVDMYAKCGALTNAEGVFHDLSKRDTISWNALITGYAQHWHSEEAINCFEEMQREGLFPDAITFACILKSCGNLGAAERGEEIHARIVREGLLETNNVLGNALVDMYAKCGVLDKACQVFDQLPVRDIISWNALIAGYCQHGQSEETLKCFEQMQYERLSPDSMTFACILRACGSIGAIEKGKEIHDEIVRKSLLGEDSVLWNALIDMYAKCGELVKAQEVFDELPVRGVVSWTALIAGYAQHGHAGEALDLFERMQGEGFCPDSVTFLCILKACSSIGAADKGEKIHEAIIREGLLGKDSLLSNSLVDMYAKCGALAKAQEVFDDLLDRDVVVWTALMAGYAQLGNHDIVFDLFKKLMREGIEPDLATFTVVLNACSSSGLVKEGEMYFKIMSERYGILPTLEHQTCMVDLFARAGDFEKAMTMIKKMSSCDYLPAWSSLLGACAKWGNVKLGRLAFEHSIRLDEKSAGAYVHMSEIYASAGMQEDADMINALKMRNGQW